jgi:hypothetical protein
MEIRDLLKQNAAGAAPHPNAAEAGASAMNTPHTA